MRRLSLVCLAVVGILFVGGAAEAQSQIRQSAAKPAPTKPTEEIGNKLMKDIINQLLASLGRPSVQVRLHLRSSSDLGTTIEDLDGRLDLNFRKNLAFPTESLSGDKQLDQLIPMVHVGLAGVRMMTRLNMDEKTDVLNTDIRFSKGGPTVPVLLEVKSDLVEFLSAKLYGLNWTITGGITGSNPKAAVTGTCDMEQAVINAQNQIVWQKVDCRFSGTYNRQTKKYEVDFNYDSLR